MINEALEAKELLSGKPVGEKTRYRACYLLAKWYKQSGRTPVETRDAIFAWATGQGYFIKDRVNGIVRRAFLDPEPLREDEIVRISEADVDAIACRFDRLNVRLTALAFLCYAKVHADDEGEFDISCSAVAEWIGVNRGNIASRVIPELVAFGYIEKINQDPSQSCFTWNKTIKSRMLRVRICVNFANQGEFSLENNDIDRLYRTCFAEPSLMMDTYS